MLKEKAVEIAQSIGTEDPLASNGWLECFKIRHNISFRKVCGESGDVRKVCGEPTDEYKSLSS